MSEDCIFCKIIQGSIPSNKIYEDNQVLVFKDIQPVAPVHYLINPKKHIVSLNETGEEDKELLAHILLVAKKIGNEEPALEKNYRIVSSTGPKAGQIVNHLHFHLIGGRDLTWPPG